MVTAMICVARHWTALEVAKRNTANAQHPATEPIAVARASITCNRQKTKSVRLAKVSVYKSRSATFHTIPKKRIWKVSLVEASAVVIKFLLCAMRGWFQKNFGTSGKLAHKSIQTHKSFVSRVFGSSILMRCMISSLAH